MQSTHNDRENDPDQPGLKHDGEILLHIPNDPPDASKRQDDPIKDEL